MNKERRNKHETTPRPHLCKAVRPRVEKTNSSFKGKIDKDTLEYLMPQCADESKKSTCDCDAQTSNFSDSQKRKNEFAIKRKKYQNTELKGKVPDYKMKMLFNHLATDSHFAYGLYIANELRKYDSKTLAYSKKGLSEIIFDADTGILLNRYHSKNFQPCANVPSNGNLHHKLKLLPNYLTTDSYFAYGQYIANELRKYDHQTLPCVKKAFSELIFEADNGTLLSSYHSRNLKPSVSVPSAENEHYASCEPTPPTTSSANNEINFQKDEEWKDIIPGNVETSVNPFQSTEEEVNSSWEDVLSDPLPVNSEENDSSLEYIDTSTEIMVHSSPEIMRFEDNNFSEEVISPLEYPRKTIDFEESDLIFIPKLASTQVECSLESSMSLDRPVHQSTKLGVFSGNKNANVNVPDISDFVAEVKEDPDSLENENSMPSTIHAPDFFDFEDVKEDALVINTTPDGFENVLNLLRKGQENTEISCLTTINTEDIIDSVFKHPDEPSSPKFDDALITAEVSGDQHTPVMNKRSLNEVLNNTPLTGRKEHEKISPKLLFFRHRYSSVDPNASNNSQSNEKKGERRKKRSIPICTLRLPELSSSYSNRFKDKRDPYYLPSDDSELEVELSILRNSCLTVSDSFNARIKTTEVKTKRKSTVKATRLSKKEIQEWKDYLQTIPICPLSLQNSCCARLSEEYLSDEI